MRFVGGDLFHLNLPALTAKATVTITAVDRAGNRATSKEMTLAVP